QAPNSVRRLTNNAQLNIWDTRFHQRQNVLDEVLGRVYVGWVHHEPLHQNGRRRAYTMPTQWVRRNSISIRHDSYIGRTQYRRVFATANDTQIGKTGLLSFERPPRSK